ncbi:hypothetical protein Pmani_029878 [Petrolisthes manimaculis]|uniref:Uncharacterized protein n=1 Tax=Petrolisthes manimaculis TaxID=1843537 RepID=A0AAE1NZ43_9EUCA|nr:hypothetical protein Pmani_029878 [Petrolisthes manimaculis]
MCEREGRRRGRKKGRRRGRDRQDVGQVGEEREDCPRGDTTAFTWPGGNINTTLTLITRCPPHHTPLTAALDTDSSLQTTPGDMTTPQQYKQTRVRL